MDTKAAGFVVLDVPLNAQMTVAGKLSGSGEERVIAATGVRY